MDVGPQAMSAAGVEHLLEMGLLFCSWLPSKSVLAQWLLTVLIDEREMVNILPHGHGLVLGRKKRYIRSVMCMRWGSHSFVSSQYQHLEHHLAD